MVCELSIMQGVVMSKPKAAVIGGGAGAGGGAPAGGAAPALPDARAKQVLKEAVDAVVNSFAKHTQGYGRGESLPMYCNIIFNNRSIRTQWVKLYFRSQINVNDI